MRLRTVACIVLLAAAGAGCRLVAPGGAAARPQWVDLAGAEEDAGRTIAAVGTVQEGEDRADRLRRAALGGADPHAANISTIVRLPPSSNDGLERICGS